jgi:hypothetical protein
MDLKVLAWLAIAFIAGMRLYSRQVANPALPVGDGDSDRKRLLWNRLFIAQNELASQSRTVEALDAILGVIIGVAGALGLYLLDHMRGTNGAVPLHHYVSAGFTVLATVIAVSGWSFGAVEKVRIRVMEESLEMDEVDSLRDSIAQTAKLTAARRQAERLKRVAQQFAVWVLLIAVFVFAEPWW